MAVTALSLRSCHCAQVEPNISPYDAYSALCCCNDPPEAMAWLAA